MSTLKFIQKSRKTWNQVDVRDKGPVFSKVRGLMMLSREKAESFRRGASNGHLNMSFLRSGPRGRQNREDRFLAGRPRAFTNFEASRVTKELKNRWRSS